MLNFKSATSFFALMLMLLVIGLAPHLTQNVFAASPISSAVANDPDDGDTAYSVGDTITITFPGATNATASGTMSNLEFRANFTIDTTDIDTLDTVTGTWDGTSTILTLVIDTIAGVDPPTANTDTVNYDVTNGNLFYAVNATVGGGGTEFLANTVILTGDFGLFVAATATSSSNGSGCSGDCEEPTLGLDSKGKRLVDNGFTYNGKSIDVERFFTPYPLVTVNVGKQNVAEFKIYENLGTDKISHFELAFGLASGESIGMSKAVINWDKSFDGVETVTLDDPENVLDSVKVTTSEGYCSDDSQTKCLIVKVSHMFRAPLDFNILGTNVWDAERNAWQNYYNHGIEIVGESLNPPKEYDGVNKGHIYHLTETGKNSAVDDFGNSWTLKYDQWYMDYVSPEKVIDTSSIMTRVHSEFPEYKQLQVDNAVEQLLVLCPTCLMSFTDFEDSFNFELPERINKLDDPEIMSKMIFESERAEKIMSTLLDPSKFK
ncbi:hypothetical protein [Nitrosopumilus adriaticus]|uniref:hypothetical protein n=1 Tax=Nitrosopumilus adriaticus TaxID=1580092 RepID=UPI00352DEF65